MEKKISVTFDFAQQKIVIEGEEGDLMKLAQEAKALAPLLKEITITTKTAKPTMDTAASQPTAHPVGASERHLGMREFARALPVSSVYEKIAALGYHVNKIQGKQSFSNSEISDWFGLCGWPKPASVAVALNDARRYRGYVESKSRGQWAITTAGENLIIEMLEKQKK